MKNYIELFGQIIFAALLVAVAVGTVASTILPYWLAVRVAAFFLAAFVAGGFSLACLLLIWCGMLLQQREHDARVIGLLKKAGVNVG